MRDGRVLEVGVSGPKDGTGLVFHHGTPGSILSFDPFIQSTLSRGLRYISYSRPGYANSSRRPGRSIGECSKDVEEILDQIQAHRCYVIGWSGGGPHALACAALLPDRVIAASTIAGVAPYGLGGLDWLGGMGRENIEEFHAALAGEDELKSFLAAAAHGFSGVTPDRIISALGDLVDEVDKAALTDKFATFLVENSRVALENGFWGWFDDDIAFTRDWGFDLSQTRVPVNVWQGAKDRMVPFAHGRWLAEHIPGARPHLLPHQGHLSLAINAFDEILDDLMSTSPT